MLLTTRKVSNSFGNTSKKSIDMKLMELDEGV